MECQISDKCQMSDIKSSMVNEKKKEQKEQKEDWVVG
jgi:hypothetical protein